MSIPLLSRPAPAGHGLTGALALAPMRVHEVCGPARQVLAAMIAGDATGPVIWIRPAWTGDRLYPDGMAGLMDPVRLILVLTQRTGDLLWSTEEALRSAAAPLVVTELTELPGLTPVRRLHLAAAAGAETGAPPPTGLLLTPGDGGAAGVESRWHIAPAWPGGWDLSRRRARAHPPRDWRLTHDGGRFHLGPPLPRADTPH